MKAFMKKHYAQLLLALIILVQLGYTTYVFTFEKQGVHSDEIWSYGLANGYEQPFIYLQSGVKQSEATFSDYINYNEWITGEDFLDYITVQPGERFAYGAVWENQIYDCHPPLYYLLLHTICSLFPNQFSFWYAYVLSILGLIGTQIYLYRLAREISGKSTVALLVCAFYGAGMGALCTFIFLRQYHLLTMLGVAFTYYSTRFCRALSGSATETGSGDDRTVASPSRFPLRWLLCAAMFALLMFLTHYTAIAYVGVFTALLCLWLLARRRFRACFSYGGSILASLVLFFVVYPAAIEQIGGNGGNVTTLFSFATQIRLLLDLLGQYNLGFEVDMFGTAFWRILPPFLALGLVLIALLLFPFRHEVWFGQLLTWVRKLPRRILHFLQRADYLPLITLVSALALYPVVGKIVDVYRMGEYAMRYIFMSFPLICFAAVYAVYLAAAFCSRKLAVIIANQRRAGNHPERIAFFFTAALAACISVRVHIIGPCPFLFEHYGNYEDATELLAGKNVLIIGSEKSDAWLLTCYCQYVCEASQVFYTTADTIEDYTGEIEALGESIDYCLVTAGTIDLTEEEIETVTTWFADGEPDTETDDTGASIIVDEEDDSDADEPAECGSVIRGLSNGGDYTLLFGMNIQGGLVYVLGL